MKLTEIIESFNDRLGGYELNQVYIISPYISHHFFDELNELHPKKILLVTDAGVSEDAVRAVRRLLNKRLTVRFAQCDGIVHAKAYLFRWRNNEEEHIKTLFLWGSCNATDGGFGRNAEIYSWMTEIPDKEKMELVNYFRNLEAKGHIRCTQIMINNIIISLPDLDFINPERESTFDLWLQKGILCHPFPNDNSFRHFKLKLRNRIGTDDEVLNIFKENRLYPIQQTTISYDYLRESKRVNQFKGDNNSFIQWKSQCFTDTIYGFWTSVECYEEIEDSIGRQDSPRRKDEIRRISMAEEAQKKEWIDNFFNLLIKVCEEIKKINRNLNDYFECRNGVIDDEYYRKIFMKQLNRDQLRSCDRWFKNCYIKGFEFIEVPPLKNFSKNWDVFVVSFCEALLSNIKLNKSNKLSQALNSINEFGKVVDDIDDGNDLSKWLRENWKKHESTIRGFYLR